MLLIFRFLTFLLLSTVICLVGSLCCLVRPRDPQHVARFGHLLGRLAPLLGLRVICRFPSHVERFGQAVYIGNHQNNYDMFTISCMVPPRTVTIGKQSLIWIPIFGPLYWLSGNILLNRRKHNQAYSTITQVVRQLQTNRQSVWIFPEGTRTRGRGLMPFKKGAFHTAIAAGVPIIPICASNLHRKVHWNRWHNGSVIIEMLAPIATEGYGKHQARELADYCYQLMQAKITQLEAEVAQRDRAALLKSTSRENV